MPFKPGQSGNPGGRSKAKPISDMYRKLLAQNPDKLEKFCLKQIELACNGDTNAIKEITDSVEGRAIQSVDVSDSRTVDGPSRLEALLLGAVTANSSETDPGRTQ